MILSETSIKKLMALYEDFARGDCSLGYLARAEGVTNLESLI